MTQPSLGEIGGQQSLHGRDALQVLPLEELVLTVQAGVAVELMMGLLHVIQPSMWGHVQFNTGQQSPPAGTPLNA